MGKQTNRIEKRRRTERRLKRQKAVANEQRRARELQRRRSALLDRCSGVVGRDLDDDAVTPLTSREREIAARAADRLSNREIAERLVVSVRTVENHLARVYVKLGVDGRRDLRDALGCEPVTE